MLRVAWLIGLLGLCVHCMGLKNVLMVVLDDVGPELGYMHGSSPFAQTPNLDQLARDSGVLFQRAYTAAPICTPGRNAVLFGMAPPTTGLFYVSQPARMSPKVGWKPSLTEYFRAAGNYHVEMGGKVFHNAHTEARSFDSYLSCDAFNTTLATYLPLSYMKRILPRRETELVRLKSATNGWKDISSSNASINAWMQEHNVLVVDHELTDIDSNVQGGCLVQAVKQKLKRGLYPQEKPFFLALGMSTAHLPLYVPSSKYEEFRRAPLRTSQPPESHGGRAFVKEAHAHLNFQLFETQGKLQTAWSAYLTAIHIIDKNVGTLLDALKTGPYANDTIVVLWSDHGTSMGEFQLVGKPCAWNVCTRVPLIVRDAGPWVTTRAAPVDWMGAVSTMDVYPTLMQLSGLANVPLHERRMRALQHWRTQWSLVASASNSMAMSSTYPFHDRVEKIPLDVLDTPPFDGHDLTPILRSDASKMAEESNRIVYSFTAVDIYTSIGPNHTQIVWNRGGSVDWFDPGDWHQERNLLQDVARMKSVVCKMLGAHAISWCFQSSALEPEKLSYAAKLLFAAPPATATTHACNTGDLTEHGRLRHAFMTWCANRISQKGPVY